MHLVFDGSTIALGTRSEIEDLRRVTISTEKVVRFMSMKAKDGSAACAPRIRAARYDLDFPRGGSRSGVYATPDGRHGYEYHLVLIDG